MHGKVTSTNSSLRFGAPYSQFICPVSVFGCHAILPSRWSPWFPLLSVVSLCTVKQIYMAKTQSAIPAAPRREFIQSVPLG